MVDKLQLQKMSEVDITKISRYTLAEISRVQIDNALPAAQKLESYIEQVGNPYCFRCGDTPVKIRFVTKNRTLKEALYTYFSGLK